jgi:hypothetical protein
MRKTGQILPGQIFHSFAQVAVFFRFVFPKLLFPQVIDRFWEDLIHRFLISF